MSHASNIREWLHAGESLNVEFKTCRRALNRDVFETVCAFLNRHGGHLLLGVRDNGEVSGVEPEAMTQIRKDFVTTTNNPQKLSPPCHLAIDAVPLDGHTILHVYVPESSQVHRCKGRIFDRNEDGDFDITDNTGLVAQLYQRKQSSYAENRIYPHVGMADLRADLIADARKRASIQKPDHPWQAMDDRELLESAQLYLKNFRSGEEGFTLAAVLLLGCDDVILSVLPHHRTDLIVRRKDLDRYDDRDDVRTNLLESYQRIMAFVAKHLPDTFHLQGDQRINIRDHIFREVAANLLIHRDFLNGFPAKLVIERGRVVAENSNKPHGQGLIDPQHFTPFPKNPVIARFFREIGRADELGSGVRKLFRYGKIYGGREPELQEGDVFRTLVAIPEEPDDDLVSGAQSGGQSGVQSGVQSGAQSGAQSMAMLSALQDGPLPSSELATTIGLKTRTGAFQRNLRELLEHALIEYTLPDKPNSRLQKYRLTPSGRAQLEHADDE